LPMQQAPLKLGFPITEEKSGQAYRRMLSAVSSGEIFTPGEGCRLSLSRLALNIHPGYLSPSRQCRFN